MWDERRSKPPVDYAETLKHTALLHRCAQSPLRRLLAVGFVVTKCWNNLSLISGAIPVARAGRGRAAASSIFPDLLTFVFRRQSNEVNAHVFEQLLVAQLSEIVRDAEQAALVIAKARPSARARASNR